MAIVAKFATLSGGVWLEEGPADRAFRFTATGQAEWCYRTTLLADGDRTRWFGHVYTAKDFILC